jgi:hypothetical protein
MYTILVTKDNELIATQKQAIMQYRTMINKLQFLVPRDYEDEDMSTYKVEMEYLSPVSHIYRSTMRFTGVFRVLSNMIEIYSFPFVNIFVILTNFFIKFSFFTKTAEIVIFFSHHY